jgi:hypothetical protein
VLALLVLPLSTAGCWFTEREVLRARDSLKLAGPRLTIQQKGGFPAAIPWNDESASYLDPQGRMAVRFARLKGDDYLAQIHVLKSEMAPGAGANPDRPFYMLMTVTVVPPRLLIQVPMCKMDGAAGEYKAFAAAYGVTADEPRDHPISGTRTGILRFITANLPCEKTSLDELGMTAESLSPGGPELGLAAAPPARGR